MRKLNERFGQQRAVSSALNPYDVLYGALSVDPTRFRSTDDPEDDMWDERCGAWRGKRTATGVERSWERMDVNQRGCC
jgi:hypothetical protein